MRDSSVFLASQCFVRPFALRGGPILTIGPSCGRSRRRLRPRMCQLVGAAMISHHHKCVFVHIPKNAGQSIELVFLNLLGLTWETRAPLLIRQNDQPEIGPPRLGHMKWWEYVAHKYMTQAQFDEYFKFSFVRNPWSRVVSMYKYFGFQNHCGFNDFVMNHLRTRMWSERHWFVGPQCDFICDDKGRLMIDFVGRVETLQADFLKVCDKIGLPPLEVPHFHASPPRQVRKPPSIFSRSWFRRRRPTPPSFATFQEYYDRDSRDVVAQLYERDIALFGYDFDGHAAERIAALADSRQDTRAEQVVLATPDAGLSRTP